MRFLEIGLGRDSSISNPVATIILVPFISAPQFLGVLLWDNFEATVCVTIAMVLIFVTSYLQGIRLAKKPRKNGTK